MKKLIILSFVLLFVAACKTDPVVDGSAVAVPEKQSYSFVEGEHYKVMDLPVLDGAVWEVFSVYCPFCSGFNGTVLPAVDQKFPGGLETIYFANYGQYGHELAEVLAVMKVLGDGKYEAVTSFYFDEIVAKRGQNIGEGSEQLVAMGLAAGGISREYFKNVLESPEAKSVLDRWQELSTLIVKESGGIPALVVKGRYLIALDKISSEDMMMAEIEYLLAK